MSVATLKVVNKDGYVIDYKEYHNSWGGAARIWTSLLLIRKLFRIVSI